MKKLIAGGLIVLAVLLGFYIGSPYMAVRSLRNAAFEGNSDKIEAKVDFPAVRESLKSQLTASMMTSMNSDPDMRDNPFSGIGAMIMPAMIDRMVDSFVTPEGIAASIRGQKPTDKAKLENNPDIVSRTEYVNLDRFRVRVSNRKAEKNGLSLLFERRGFASWKLIRLEMPADLLKNK